MIKKILIGLCLLAGFVSVVQAQKEAYNWTFGKNCGLTWNTRRNNITCTGMYPTPDAILPGLPDILPNVAISTEEGCFSISDGNGQMLFYSDGITIWNRNNIAMPNGSGMNGDPSSAQSGIVIPYPGHDNQYLAVSLGWTTADNPAYSVVDMSLQGGLGDVLPNAKNKPLTGQTGTTGESITAIKHANGKDYWIVAPGKGRGISTMNAWLVTKDSIYATAPVKTPIGFDVALTPSVGGYFKFTPDAKHFFWATAPRGPYALVGDFDSSTGKFSNMKTTGFSAYGAEFTPSGKYLYANVDSYNTYVYDFALLLIKPTGTGSAASTRKFVCYVNDVGAIQMGPDGRMYIDNYNGTAMFIVDNPEDVATGLRVYKTPNNFLGTGIMQAGLPSFSASWFAPSCPSVMRTNPMIRTVVK